MLKKGFVLIFVLLLFGSIHWNADAEEPQVVILGTDEASIDFYKSKDFWGPVDDKKPLSVPRIIVVAVNDSWSKDAAKMPVDLKKEFFFRAIVPMILYENHEIMRDRDRLKGLANTLKKGKPLNEADTKWLEALASRYALKNEKSDGKKGTLSPAEMDELVKRVDIIPPSLALAQAASESGYATSRFAMEGNALFGQWTYGGKGIKAKGHREEKGNYRVAAFDWPFDSLRSYVNNLNTHSAYADFRDKRAEFRRKNEPITGLGILHTLTNYSERGKDYIKDLEAIITFNKLDVADRAKLRDEPVTLVVNVNTAEEVKEVQKEIDQMRVSGEFKKAIESMRLTQ